MPMLLHALHVSAGELFFTGNARFLIFFFLARGSHAGKSSWPDNKAVRLELLAKNELPRGPAMLDGAFT